MQFWIEDLLVTDGFTYLIIKIGTLLVVLLLWMIVMSHPAYKEYGENPAIYPAGWLRRIIRGC